MNSKYLLQIAGFLFAGAASAQSSVTIFGTVDAGVGYGSGSLTNKTQMRNSGLSSSRLGFSGSEKLNDGLSVSFWLEAGINPSNGSGQPTNTNNQASGAISGTGMDFNRRSTLSLTGGFGELRMGRDYTPHYWNHVKFDPFGNLGVGSSRALAGNGAGYTSVRASSSLAYLSPSFNNFKIQIQTYSGENPSNQPDAGTGNSLRLEYRDDLFEFGMAYAKTTTGAGKSVESKNIGAAYKFSNIKFMAALTKDSNTGAVDVDGTIFGVIVPTGRSGVFKASFSGTEKGAAETRQLAFGYVHDLSKRTSLYATYARLKNSGGAAAALNGSTTAPNKSSSGVDIGFRHFF